MGEEVYHILNRSLANLKIEDFASCYQVGDKCYVSEHHTQEQLLVEGCAILEELSAIEISEIVEFYKD